MNKNSLAFLVVGLLIGIVAGYVVGMIVYQSQISQLQSDLSDTQDSLSASQAQVESLQNSLSTAEQQISNLQSDLATAEDTISSLESDLIDAGNTITNYESQITNLESHVADLLLRITPESGYETILMYGFSLEYPEYMDMSVSGLLSASGADEHSGLLAAEKPDETEIILALWMDTVYPRDLDDALDTGIAGTPGVTSTGERVTSIINGHIIKYQSFTAVIEGKTFNAVLSYWNCDSTQRVYGLEYMTIEEDPISGFMQILDSFICH
jgi:flagellar biosynthesis chaperone FliJ